MLINTGGKFCRCNDNVTGFVFVGRRLDPWPVFRRSWLGQKEQLLG